MNDLSATANAVAIAMLTYSLRPYDAVSEFIMTETGRIREELGRPVLLLKSKGAAIISYARNSMVMEFLQSQATDLIFVDDDNHPDSGGFVRLLRHPVDVCGLPCRSRTEPLRWPVRWLLDRPIARDVMTGLIEVETVGTGILRITRAAIERFVAAHVDNWYVDEHSPTGRTYEFFQTTVVDRVPWGEDTHFCRAWRVMGGRVWIDPDVTTHHYGAMDYSGSVASWLTASSVAITMKDTGKLNPDVDLPNAFSHVSLQNRRVALCIASRNNPASLAASIRASIATSVLSNTMVLVGLDEDDTSLEATLAALKEIDVGNISAIVNPRQDSLGAVYNGIAEAFAADLYVNAADDLSIATPGWDARLLQEAERFEDGVGVLGVGKMPIPSMLPGLEATTRGMIEAVGRWMQTDTPYWWTDTDLWELAVMIGRLLPVPDIVLQFGPRPMLTRGLRDVTHWARVFDETRMRRREIAEAIIESDTLQSEDGTKKMLLGRLNELCRQLQQGNAVLRDESHVTDLQSHDAPEDERYRRIKEKSLKLLSA